MTSIHSGEVFTESLHTISTIQNSEYYFIPLPTLDCFAFIHITSCRLFELYTDLNKLRLLFIIINDDSWKKLKSLENCECLTCNMLNIRMTCFIKKKINVKTYLVNTRHNNVADKIVNCCDKADWDFCIALWRSFWNRNRD